jgi:tRNA(fMet)-specific endonuclease VapC
MKRYMLDTNTVSHLIKGHPAVTVRVQAVPMTALCISAITEGELQFGLSKRPQAKRLHLAVDEFLKRVDVLPWDGTVAPHYGALRAAMELLGQILAPLDLLIAGHALSASACLVTNDRAFAEVPQLELEDWTQE